METITKIKVAIHKNKTFRTYNSMDIKNLQELAADLAKLDAMVKHLQKNPIVQPRELIKMFFPNEFISTHQQRLETVYTTPLFAIYSTITVSNRVAV